MVAVLRSLLLHGIATILVLLVTTSAQSGSWSMSESDADFMPSFSLLEQWSELPFAEAEVMERQDTLKADRVDKVMKKPPIPDRIINRPPNKSQDVSETDLFLLGAIEKLAYRVDFLEKRTRRLEDMMYQLIAGPTGSEGEQCPEGFSRRNGVCYHVSTKQVNWKSASSMCRSLGGILLELQGEDERNRFIASLQADPQSQGSDFWTGGLNPGLLWLWGTSAKPVSSNSTHSDITGSGRCLLLAYQPPTRSYLYRGSDCGGRHRYVCQLEDKATERRLQRLLRDRTELTAMTSSN